MTIVSVLSPRASGDHARFLDEFGEWLALIRGAGYPCTETENLTRISGSPLHMK